MGRSRVSLKSHIDTMKRIIALVSLAGLFAASVSAGEAACCASKGSCKDKQASMCPVTKARQQAKGAAGSTKEQARATKAFLQIASH